VDERSGRLTEPPGDAHGKVGQLIPAQPKITTLRIKRVEGRALVENRQWSTCEPAYVGGHDAHVLSKGALVVIKAPGRVPRTAG
jgi:hypothetical protein